MKIALPVDENKMESTVCVSFGRTPYFLIYDIESGQHDFILNEAANSQGGAGIKAAQSIVDVKVDALLTPRLGENAAEVIGAANIALYKTLGNSIIDNINAFKNNTLESLTEVHKGLHNHGK